MTISNGIIGKINRDTQIYRILSRTRFLDLFTEEENALVLPTMWTDPFENLILKADVISATGKKEPLDLLADVYAQCWTMETISDAMWQIYSRDKNAVRVRTTVEKLIDNLREVHGRRADTTCFIGSVDYLKDYELKAFGNTVFKDGVNPKSIAQSLLVKRWAYRHENEVRLIYLENSKADHPKNVYKYRFDPRGIIDQVMVDGRVAYPDFLPFKKRVMHLTGLSGEQIKRSLLYEPPKGFVVKIP